MRFLLSLLAAALFATGSVIAVTVASDQRRAEAESASSSTAALEQRYAAAASDIDAWGLGRWPLALSLGLIAILATLTTIQRIVFTYQQAKSQEDSK